jgi:hypothetical protein
MSEAVRAMAMGALAAALAGCAPRLGGGDGLRLEVVSTGGATFRIQYQAVDGADAEQVKAVLPRVAARAARWSGLRSPVTITIHSSHDALERAIHREGYGWLRAWARYATIDVQSPRTWAFLGAGDGEVEELLTHELTHCTMYQAAADEWTWPHRRIPPWFREGMASVTAGQARRRADRDGLRAWYSRLIPGAGDVEVPGGEARIDPLVDPERLYKEEETVVYGASHWAFQFLLDRYGEERIRRILDRMGQGRSFPEAFREGIGIGADDFEREFRHYLAWHGWR